LQAVQFPRNKSFNKQKYNTKFKSRSFSRITGARQRKIESPAPVDLVGAEAGRVLVAVLAVETSEKKKTRSFSRKTEAGQ
jgi:hypothetical protein